MSNAAELLVTMTKAEFEEVIAGVVSKVIASAPEQREPESACRNPEMRKLREQLLLLGPAPSPVSTLPDAPAQYLFLRPDGDLELWKLTAHGWFDATGTHYDSPLERNPGLTQWGRARL